MKINKKLIVEIPKRFKRSLEGRVVRLNGRKCILCKRFKRETDKFCSYCPFVKFRDVAYGCVCWKDEVMKFHKLGYWGFHHLDNKFGRYPACYLPSYRKFLKIAKRYIKWV